MIAACRAKWPKARPGAAPGGEEKHQAPAGRYRQCGVRIQAHGALRADCGRPLRRRARVYVRRQLHFGDPSPIEGGPELVPVVAVAEAFPLPPEDEAALQVRHAEADDERENKRYSGAGGGDSGEREQNLSDADVDGGGGDLAVHRNRWNSI